MTDTSMQDAQKKRQANKKIDKSMEEAIVNMNPIELAEYFTELRSEGYDDDAIAQLRAKAAENLAVAGTGKASEFMKKVKDKADAAPDPEPEAPAEEAKEDTPEPKKDMYADDKPAKKTKKKSSKKKKAAPTPEPVAEETPVEQPVGEPESTETAEETLPPARLATEGDGAESVDETDGPMLLIPDHDDLFLCEAVPDGYEDVGSMISGPWKNMEELEAAAERWIKNNDDGDVTDLYVVQVTKKVSFETKIVLTFK